MWGFTVKRWAKKTICIQLFLQLSVIEEVHVIDAHILLLCLDYCIKLALATTAFHLYHYSFIITVLSN